MKDLKIFSRDRGSLFFFIVFPFLFIILFNFLLAGVGSEDERLEMHLATREPAGGLSHQIINSMETRDISELEVGDPVIIRESDYNAARQAVEDGELAGFLAFPADFTESVMSGEPTELEIFADDVKCTHGSTVGREDTDALFYLQARGIDRQQAHDLLVYAFANSIVSQITVPSVRLAIETRLLEARGLPRMDHMNNVP